METSTSQQSNAEGEPSVEIQKLRAQTEVAHLAFKEKELTANLEMARIEITHHEAMEKQFGNNKTKTFTISALISFSSLAVVLAFIAWCLSLGKEQFVIDLFKYSLYPISAGGGYWVGRISRQQKALE